MVFGVLKARYFMSVFGFGKLNLFCDGLISSEVESEIVLMLLLMYTPVCMKPPKNIFKSSRVK